MEGRLEDTWQGWYAVVEAVWLYNLGMCEPEKGQGKGGKGKTIYRDHAVEGHREDTWQPGAVWLPI